MTSGKPRLTVDVPVKPDDSFKASDTIFTTGNLHIDRSGVYRDSGSQPVASPASQASSGVLIKDIGELDLQEQLGRGSTGVVHRALHHTSGLNLAVKQISIFDKDQRRSLVKELQTLYEADCEHLVNFYGAFYDHGSIYIVLEHMQLGSLVDLLASVRRRQQQHDGHGLPEIVCAYLSKQVLLALQYLHNARHMVHRDIKPSNILLTRDARPKITDFGISTELPENAVATTFVGTCTYMRLRLRGLVYGDTLTWSARTVLNESLARTIRSRPISGAWVSPSWSARWADTRIRMPASTWRS